MTDFMDGLLALGPALTSICWFIGGTILMFRGDWDTGLVFYGLAYVGYCSGEIICTLRTTR